MYLFTSFNVIGHFLIHNFGNSFQHFRKTSQFSLTHLMFLECPNCCFSHQSPFLQFQYQMTAQALPLCAWCVCVCVLVECSRLLIQHPHCLSRLFLCYHGNHLTKKKKQVTTSRCIWGVEWLFVPDLVSWCNLSARRAGVWLTGQFLTLNLLVLFVHLT